MRKINWKKGSGAIIYGSCVLIAGMALLMMTIEKNHIFHESVYMQTRTDTIADGAAEYGHRSYGLNTDAVLEMANKLNTYNNNLYDKDMTVTINQSSIRSNDDVVVETTSDLKMLFSDTSKSVSKNATTHAVTDTLTGQDIDLDAFPADHTQPVHPYYNSIDGIFTTRKPQIINDIIGQFEILLHPRYTPTESNDNSRSQILLWDYSIAMDCEIPIKTLDNKIKTATEICDWMLDPEGQSAGWKSVSASEAQAAANKGQPAVMIKREEGQNGIAYIIRYDQSTYSEAKGLYVATAAATKSESMYEKGYLTDESSYYFFIHS